MENEILLRIKAIIKLYVSSIGICNIKSLPLLFYDYFKIKKAIAKKINPYKLESRNYSEESFEKYMQLDYWVFETLLRFYYLGLHKCKRKLKILDIGTGMGYFPFICNYYGHDAEAIDLDSNKLYNFSVAALNVRRFNERIIAFTPLSLKSKYDLITAYMICFNGHKSDNLWYKNEWKFFLESLQKNNLLKNGMIFLSLNKEFDSNENLTISLMEYFVAIGAKVNGNKVKIDQDLIFMQEKEY